MMRTLEQLCRGCKMQNLSKIITIKKHFIGFFDDTKQYANNWITNNAIHMIQIIQHSTKTQEHLLFTSGGKIELSKYAAYIINKISTKKEFPK